MPNLMQRGADWLGDKLKLAAGRTVTLQMDTGEVALTGWVSRYVQELVDAEGFTTLLVNYDWSFKRDEILLNGAEVLPVRGNRIVETLNGNDVTYEIVLTPEKGAMQEQDTSDVIVTFRTQKIGVDG